MRLVSEISRIRPEFLFKLLWKYPNNEWIGPDSPETITTEVAPDLLHSSIGFPTVLLHLFTPEEYISPTTNSGIWEITNCDLYEDPTLVGLQRLFGRFAPTGSYIHFVGVISKKAGLAGSIFGSRVVTGEGIQFKTDEHIRAWLMFMGGADIIQFVGIICPQF